MSLWYRAIPFYVLDEYKGIYILYSWDIKDERGDEFLEKILYI